MGYPKDLNGKETTQEQWDRYEADLQEHEAFIKERRSHLNHICSLLEFLDRGKLWSVTQLSDAINNEIDKSWSMDAPNKPGYYRANND